MPRSARATSVYRLSVAHLLRILGPAAILLGVAWVVVAAAGLASGWAIALGAVTVAAILAATSLLWRRPRILTLGDVGYRIGPLAAGGRQVEVAWRAVESVTTADVGRTRALVFNHSDGTRRAVPLSMLGAAGPAAQREINRRLNDAYGYRPL